MLEQLLGRIHNVDCVSGMQQIDAESVDLVFADPPFNIGYKYDKYDDSREEEEYLAWSKRWMEQVYRIVKPNGAFWLAIGDEYAAELKLLAKQIGYKTRNWVVWYYTFGVHCHSKFTRSHAHLFYFVKENSVTKFNFSEIAVPSARQLVYNDRRSNPEGRSPDDTWILRPQDCLSGFNANEDVWYFPRVAGTFKERAGFHGCQMPEQLLGRIIRACSNEGDIVLDPFSGSSTTVAVAKKLKRKYLSFELSEDYVTLGNKRLDDVEPGDALDGAPEPKASAPATYARLKKPKVREKTLFDFDSQAQKRQIIDAFKHVHRGCSIERVLIDPVLNLEFQTACDYANILGTPCERNETLLDLQREGELHKEQIDVTNITVFDWAKIDAWVHASEIAWQQMNLLYQRSLEELFCNPTLAAQFDSIAARFAPGRSSLEYRYAAIKLRKEYLVRGQNFHAGLEQVTPLFSQPIVEIDKLSASNLPSSSGIYCVRSLQFDQPIIYLSETSNLRRALSTLENRIVQAAWSEASEFSVGVQALECPIRNRLSHVLTMLTLHETQWNAVALANNVGH